MVFFFVEHNDTKRLTLICENSPCVPEMKKNVFAFFVEVILADNFKVSSCF